MLFRSLRADRPSPASLPSSSPFLPDILLRHYTHIVSPPSPLPQPSEEPSKRALTIKQLSPVHLSRLELNGDDVSETLVQELSGDPDVGHCASKRVSRLRLEEGEEIV